MNAICDIGGDGPRPHRCRRVGLVRLALFCGKRQADAVRNGKPGRTPERRQNRLTAACHRPVTGILASARISGAGRVQTLDDSRSLYTELHPHRREMAGRLAGRYAKCRPAPVTGRSSFNSQGRFRPLDRQTPLAWFGPFPGLKNSDWPPSEVLHFGLRPSRPQGNDRTLRVGTLPHRRIEAAGMCPAVLGGTSKNFGEARTT